jgi:ribosomal protein L21E
MGWQRRSSQCEIIDDLPFGVTPAGSLFYRPSINTLYISEGGGAYAAITLTGVHYLAVGGNIAVTITPSSLQTFQYPNFEGEAGIGISLSSECYAKYIYGLSGDINPVIRVSSITSLVQNSSGGNVGIGITLTSETVGWFVNEYEGSIVLHINARGAY